jgi:hypothetical protein
LKVLDDLIRMAHAECLPRSRHVPAILVAALMAGACTTPYEGRHDFYSGWRKVQITQVAPPAVSVQSTPLRCRATESGRGPPEVPWATVRYGLGGHIRHATVPASLHQTLAVGDMVYVNVNECLVVQAHPGSW